MPLHADVRRNKEHDKLSDDAWLLDLGFLKEFTAKLKVLHIELRVTDRHLPRTISAGNAYKAKLGVWTTHLKNGRQTRFTSWKKCHRPLEDKNESECPQYCAHLDKVAAEFKQRSDRVSVAMSQTAKHSDSIQSEPSH
ncbi:unnamed protein product [Boreogadus saida]